MARQRTGERGEGKLTFVSICLAALAAFFAIYMNTSGEGEIAVSSLLRMPSGTTDRPNDVQPEALDDLVTGAVTSVNAAGGAGFSPVAHSRAPAAVSTYRVVAVVGGKAYLESGRGTSLSVIAVEKGSMLPGAGRVLSIVNSAGRWIVETTKITITSDAAR
jgi:hypothetical protein